MWESWLYRLCSPSLLASKASCFAAVLHERLSAMSADQQQVALQAAEVRGSVRVVCLSLCASTGLAFIRFLRGVKIACSTQTLRVLSMLCFFCCLLCVSFVPRVFFCTAVEAVPIRNSREKETLLYIEAILSSDSPPRPSSVWFPPLPFSVCTAAPGLHSLIQLGANPAMLEQLLMEMFVPDTTQVISVDYPICASY